MSTKIEVYNKSVEELLGSAKSKKFVVPEYQRPYAWEEEQIETLFDDLWEFAVSVGGTKNDESYFLGSIVSYENESGEREIIDGQQRITSLYLLLRAIYAKLETIEEFERNDSATYFMGRIQPLIWETDNLNGTVNKNSLLLTSRVVSNEGNDILKQILKTGSSEKGAKDNYSKNFMKFQELLDRYSRNDPINIFEFIYSLLEQAVLLTVEANNQDTALTIFSTLNDRGLPLSDADIFKAKIYNHMVADEKETFINNWKDLEEVSAETGESIQQLFYYYMFYLRAKSQDTKSTTPGIRKYFSEDKFKRLYEKDLMGNLFVILNLWKVVMKGEVLEEEPWSSNLKIRQTLDILTSYPNEFWKYPVIIYYICYRERSDFEQKFLSFLNKLTAELLVKYLLTPTVNAVKSDILKLNSSIFMSDVPEFNFRKIDEKDLDSCIKQPNGRVVRMLLKVLAYSEQDDLLPEKWQIEHILPIKWQASYFKGSEEVNRENIEHIGNKLPLEQKLNIIAGNGYFTNKKEHYVKSKIAIARKLGNSNLNDWDYKSIIERDVRVVDELKSIVKIWRADYFRATAK